MHTLATTKSRWQSQTKLQQQSSPHTAQSASTQCPFGIKNAGATYQRMIQTCLANQIGKTVEAYVDDVVVKSKHVETLVDDLRLTFDNLRAYDIKLNLEKCVFGVPAGKLLGFIISGRGIEANPAKIRALSQLDIPKDLKQIQKLTGCVAALSRFISRDRKSVV